MKVTVMTALAAGLLVSTAAFAVPANLDGALQPVDGLTLVKGGGGGGGGLGGGGGQMSGGGGGGGGGGGHIAAGGGPGRMGGDAGPHVNGGGNRHMANDHDHDRFDRDRDHDHDHNRHVRFFPDDFFFGGYGGDYYGGDCGWLRREARVTGSPYWWRRYRACLAS
jgi:hypothetical protein